MKKISLFYTYQFSFFPKLGESLINPSQLRKSDLTAPLTSFVDYETSFFVDKYSPK